MEDKLKEFIKRAAYISDDDSVSDEQKKSIKELAEICEHIDNMPVSTELYKLDSEHPEKFIRVGFEFWHFISESEMRTLGLDTCQWVKIKVTYIRSGLFFYKYVDYKDVPEQWCPLNCLMMNLLHPVRFYPRAWGYDENWNWETLDGRVEIVRENDKCDINE